MNNSNSRVATVYFDIGDVLFFLMHHSSVSGIQRVVIEIWKVMDQSSRVEVIPVAFARDTRNFVNIDKIKFIKLIELLDGDAPESEVIKTAKNLHSSLSSNSELKVAGGETFIIAGSAWTEPWYFHGINDIKSQNVSVLSLVYDLIPIIFTSFPQHTRIPFMRYVYQVIMLSDSIATISNHTRKDLDEFAFDNGLIAPSGPVTQLPGGFIDKTFLESSSGSTYPENYILMVGTIEERKNHLIALKAYKKVLETLGHENTPDLICVGRLGWNVSDFVDEWCREPLIQRKFKLLTDSENDANLANLYKNALFTIYPSKYEGWGLPVSESLDFGIPVITSSASSLPEAGGEYAAYVDPGDHNDLAEKMLLWIQDPELLAKERNRIETRTSMKWDRVGLTLIGEVERIGGENRQKYLPLLESCIEYGFGNLQPIDQMEDGRKYLKELQNSRSLPMTNSLSNLRELVLGEFVVSGPSGKRDQEGITYSSDSHQMSISLDFIRDQDGALDVLIATKIGPQKFNVTIEASGENSNQIFSLGSVLSFRLSAKPKGEKEIIKLRFSNLSREDRDTITITFKSILIIDESDSETELKVIRAQLNAYANESAHLLQDQTLGNHEELLARIAALESSVSWKLTAPLRYVVRTLKRLLFRK